MPTWRIAQANAVQQQVWSTRKPLPRWAVFFGRMLPVFRSLISIPAGVSRMPLWQFGLMTMAGSFLWNTIFILAGYFLGENWHVVERYASILQYVVLVALALGILWFTLRRVQTSRRQE